MCREFHCLPSALLAEDSELLRMMRLAAEADRERGEVEDWYGE